MTLKNDSAPASADTAIESRQPPAYDPAKDVVLHFVGLVLFMGGCVVCGNLLIS